MKKLLLAIALALAPLSAYAAGAGLNLVTSPPTGAAIALDTTSPVNVGITANNLSTWVVGNLSSSSILSSSPSGGVGYKTGAGCAVTQGTNRTTGVTCTGVTGAITLVSAAGSATPATFTVTDTSVAATDTIIVNQKSGTDLYEIFVTAVGAGSFKITSLTTGGTTTEQPVFNFAVLKGVAN